MEQLNFNSILKRENLASEIKDILINFEKNKKNLLFNIFWLRLFVFFL